MEKAGRAVVVTTVHKGVFFGYLDQDADVLSETLTLFRVRMCIYWSPDVHGVFGLAANGPTAGCRIGPAAPWLTIHGVTGVCGVSNGAAERWEGEPWAG